MNDPIYITISLSYMARVWAGSYISIQLSTFEILINYFAVHTNLLADIKPIINAL